MSPLFVNSMSSIGIGNMFSCMNVLLSVGELYISGSIYDFIVMNKMFFALPKKQILIDPHWSFYQHLTAIYIFILAFSSILLSAFGQQQYKQHSPPTFSKFSYLSTIHCVLLLAATVMSAVCCNATRQTLSAVAPFAYDADPPEFQRACFWYFVRLRAAAVLFGASTILNALSCVIAKCRYMPLGRPHFTPMSF